MMPHQTVTQADRDGPLDGHGDGGAPGRAYRSPGIPPYCSARAAAAACAQLRVAAESSLRLGVQLLQTESRPEPQLPGKVNLKPMHRDVTVRLRYLTTVDKLS